MCAPYRDLFAVAEAKCSRERSCHTPDQVIQIPGTIMEIQLSVRRRPLIVPAVEISGLPVYADGSRLMCRDQLSDQAFADQHVFILHRTHGIMRSDGAHLACKNIRAVRFFIVLEQVQIKTRISENDRPVKRRASPSKGQICTVPVETEYTL